MAARLFLRLAEQARVRINPRVACGVAGAFASSLAASHYAFADAKPQAAAALHVPREPAKPAGKVVSCGWPTYTRAQVAEHTTADSGIWVTYKDGVYDITDFVDSHPGGNRILLAAGKAIDSFWNLYQQHLNSEAPMQMLKAMQIGVLDPSEVLDVVDENDPYASDPQVSDALIMHSKKPLQAETPLAIITDSWLTPNDLFFVRGHHPVPVIKEEDYRLTIKGPGLAEPKTFTFTLKELKTIFNKHEVVTTIQCGGNGRKQMNSVKKTMGIPWSHGAMGTAKWGGARLSDVLEYCGCKNPEAAGVEHVHFEGAENLTASIPADKALSRRGDVLLAYEMNGEPVPAAHGYPVRAVVPGHVGVRNVKWVTSVVTAFEEARGPWQRGIAYKGFAPGVDNFDGVDVERVPSVQEQPVMSAITLPQPGEKVEGDTVDVKGFAWSGGGRGIVRVDVSADEGKTWTTAELTEGKDQPLARAWAWTFFEASVAVPPGAKAGDTIHICAKATDASYNTQPERLDAIWNIRGILNNAWPRVPVKVDP
mmetsp:Transcript_28948/g.84853  ORF Transcript_28948/g.84853 Transcript_28948/m.84853 type:complete len:537 (-) Transcript_28948:164-1774(-)